MKKTMNIITIIALIALLVVIGGISYGYFKKATMEVKNPIVTMEVENYGTIKLELYPEIAPETVANFVKLSQNGFYDGLKFHRVVDGFMIQGGDPNGDKNTLKHQEGVISMARADYTSYSPNLSEESYNSAGSQFFIMTANNTSLDGSYAAFGKVIEGMDVVHAIEKVEVKAIENSKETEKNSSEETKEEKEKSIPVKDVVISKVTVETNGIDYGMPKTLEQWDYYDWIYKTYGIDLRSYQN